MSNISVLASEDKNVETWGVNPRGTDGIDDTGTLGKVDD